jgi:hypothetical protein
MKPSFFSIGLLPEFIVREGAGKCKKRDFSFPIRFVSLPFERNKCLYDQDYEQKCGGVCLQTDDKKEDPCRVDEKGKFTFVFFPKGFFAVLQ